MNAIPVFIASDPEWARKFRDAGVPIVGDDIKSQVGSTIVHRILTRLFEDRGLALDHTYQLNFGGNMDFKNMLERERLESKKISKTQAVTSQMEDHVLDADDVHVGPSDHVPWLKDRKWAYIRMEGRNFGDVPLNLELKLEVWDSPNSAGVIIDAVRCAKLALDRGIGGPLLGPSAYFMKSPPVQYHDDIAHAMIEAFAAGEAQESWPARLNPALPGGHARRRWRRSDQDALGRRPHAHHGQGPAHAEEHAAADRQVRQLLVRVRRVQALPERVVHGLVVEGEALGELGRQPLAVAQPGRGAPVGDLRVEGLAGPGALAVAGPGVAAHRAVVDQRDRPARRLPLAHRELRVGVDRLGERPHARRHLGRSSAQSMCSPMPLSGAVILVMGEGSPARSLLPGPPLPQAGRRRLLAERALVEAQLHEEGQRLPDGPARARCRAAP